MTETTAPAVTRFALDEARAGEWLAAEVAKYVLYCGGDTSEPGELEIGASWEPRVDMGERPEIAGLISGAIAQGILTVPAGAGLDLDADGGGDGYRWLVYLHQDPGQSLILAAAFEAAATVGEPGTRGAEAALSVLREAVESANECLDDLERYAAETGRPPAPATVHVVEFVHKHGNDLTAYTTEADAEAARAGIARLYWGDVAEMRGLPADPDELSNEEVIAGFFNGDGDDECYLHELPVIGAPGRADAEALDQLTALMTAGEWSADLADRVAEIVRATGRTIGDCVPDDARWQAEQDAATGSYRD